MRDFMQSERPFRGISKLCFCRFGIRRNYQREISHERSKELWIQLIRQFQNPEAFARLMLQRLIDKASGSFPPLIHIWLNSQMERWSLFRLIYGAFFNNDCSLNFQRQAFEFLMKRSGALTVVRVELGWQMQSTRCLLCDSGSSTNISKPVIRWKLHYESSWSDSRWGRWNAVESVLWMFPVEFLWCDWTSSLWGKRRNLIVSKEERIRLSRSLNAKEERFHELQVGALSAWIIFFNALCYFLITLPQGQIFICRSNFMKTEKRRRSLSPLPGALLSSFHCLDSEEQIQRKIRAQSIGGRGEWKVKWKRQRKTNESDAQ